MPEFELRSEKQGSDEARVWSMVWGGREIPVVVDGSVVEELADRFERTFHRDLTPGQLHGIVAESLRRDLAANPEAGEAERIRIELGDGLLLVTRPVGAGGRAP